MSHMIAHIGLDFPGTASVCGAERRHPMDAHIVKDTITANLAQIRAELEKGLRIARAAEICAGSGRINKGIEIALSLEAIVYELNTSLNATNMIKRLSDGGTV
jgi:hypothetical protein